MRNWYLMVLAFGVLGGCIPYHFTERPGAFGRVIDAETNQPINDARVQLKLDNEYIEDKGTEVKTVQDGKFCLPPRKKWGLYFFPMDCFPFQYDLTFVHNEYSQMQLQFQHSAIDEPEAIDFGTVKLKK